MHDGQHTTPEIGADAHCVGILLAAGFGRRFMAALAPAEHAQPAQRPPQRQQAQRSLERQQVHQEEHCEPTLSTDHPGKLSARLPDGRTIAEASAQTLCALTAYTVAITRPETPRLHAQLRSAGATVVVSQDAWRGMGASLAAAARHVTVHCGPGVQTALIALADMPWISAATYTQVMQAARQHAIVVPMFEGRRGHPVALHRHLWPELAQLDGDVGARALLKRHPVHEIELADPGILRDVDVPQDLPAPG